MEEKEDQMLNEPVEMVVAVMDENDRLRKRIKDLETELAYKDRVEKTGVELLMEHAVVTGC